MASWKKVLVSGSSIEVNQITASGVPTTDNESNLLVIDSNGSITQMDQANVNAGNTYFIGGADTSSVVTNLSFDTSTDYLIYTGAFDHGFGFSTAEATNTASIKLHTPQALKTTSSPTFNSLFIDNFIFSKDNSLTRIEFIGNERIGFEIANSTYLTLSASNSGEEIIINDEGGAAIDLRVEGDTNTHLLFSDSSENKIAIGTPTVNAGSLVITGAAEGIVHTNSGIVTQATNHATGVTLNTTSGVITLAAVALAATTNAEFVFTNSTLQTDSVVLLTMQDENTTNNAQLACSIHTIANGSCKISVVNPHSSGASSATASKIHFLIINNS
mgnify:CR=1 FL=1